MWFVLIRPLFVSFIISAPPSLHRTSFQYPCHCVGYLALRQSWQSRIRGRCHTLSTVLLLRWCPVLGAGAAVIADLFSIANLGPIACAQVLAHLRADASCTNRTKTLCFASQGTDCCATVSMNAASFTQPSWRKPLLSTLLLWSRQASKPTLCTTPGRGFVSFGDRGSAWSTALLIH